MALRLDLLVHGASRAARAGRFPDDDRLEEAAVAKAAALRGQFGVHDEIIMAPSCAARETAAALQIDARIDAALRHCDYGRWRGLALTEIAAREPDALAAWRQNPEAAPHGGETLSAFLQRVGAWLDATAAAKISALAIVDASFARAAVAAALGAGASAFWRVDLAPLARVRFSGHDGRWTLVALGTGP